MNVTKSTPKFVLLCQSKLSWIIAAKSFNFSEISLAVTNNDTACHLFRSALSKFWLTRVSLDGRARKWKTFAVKSLSLFSFVMEAAILKTWSRDWNYTITNAHGQHERRHFRRVSIVCACFSRRSRLSSLGQHSCNAQNSCTKVWSPETLSDAVWSSNVFLKNFKTLIKADGRKFISDGDFAVCRLILKPLI